MGLDMYLYAERYVSDWNEEGKELSNKLFELTGKRIISFRTEVGYWRKANAIHKWFVDNCQDGIDECQSTFVSVEKLEELLELVNRVLADPKLAPELLPTGSGFFFGSTEYGEYYIDDLQYTKELIEKVLNDESLNNYDFFYQSSW